MHNYTSTRIYVNKDILFGPLCPVSVNLTKATMIAVHFSCTVMSIKHIGDNAINTWCNPNRWCRFASWTNPMDCLNVGRETRSGHNVISVQIVINQCLSILWIIEQGFSWREAWAVFVFEERKWLRLAKSFARSFAVRLHLHLSFLIHFFINFLLSIFKSYALIMRFSLSPFFIFCCLFFSVFLYLKFRI